MNLLITRKAAEIAFGAVPTMAHWGFSTDSQVMFKLVDEQEVERAKHWHDIQPIIRLMLKPRISSDRLEACIRKANLLRASELRIPLI